MPKKTARDNRYLLLILAIIVIGGIFRFYNPNWDLDHYLHPDERLYVNASSLGWPKNIEEFFSPKSPLNPRMFYYGSFPLYLYIALNFIVNNIFGISINLLPLSRLISAFFSFITIVLVYLLTRNFLNRNSRLIATSLFAFSVGSIQYAHYNTTESLLTFIITLLTYLSFLLYYQFHRQQKDYINNIKITFLILSMGLFFGIAIATKVTGLSFIITSLIAFILSFFILVKRKNKVISVIDFFFLLIIAFVFISLIIAFFGAPYNILNFSSFYKEQEYMQGVILGKYKPPFTIIYEFTKPYFYQLTQIFPWIFSPIALITSICGLFYLVKEMIQKKKWSLLIIVVWPLIYFITTGQWYVKFTRYMIPLLPFLSIYSAFFYESIINKKRGTNLLLINIFFLVIVLSHFIYSYSFVSTIYNNLHTRISASYWIFKNIEPNSFIATEHWDDGLPLPLPEYSREKYQYIELTVYDPDNEQKINSLIDKVSKAGYLIFSSRRVFYSIQRNPTLYPFTSKFYNLLFAGKLGFQLVRKESRYTQISGIVLNDDIADESFQSYDHPPVYIFKNIEHLSDMQIKNLILESQ